MSDEATLSVKVVSEGVDQANAGLQNLVQTGGRAEAATAQLAAESMRAMAGFGGFASAVETTAGRVNALRATIDPTYSAQMRLANAVAEADQLYRAGHIDAGEYSRTIAVLSERQAEAARMSDMLTGAQQRSARAMGLQTHEALNLSRQMTDVGVSLAMGMNPLMVLIAQGPQIADVFASAKTRGVGFGEAMRGLGLQLGLLKVVQQEATVAAAEEAAANTALATSASAASDAEAKLAGAQAATVAGAQAATAAATEVVAANTAVTATATEAATAEAVALAPLAALLAAVAAAAAVTAGVFTAGLGLAARQLNKEHEDLGKRLGLTKEQLKSVGDTSVTMGDVFAGSWSAAVKTVRKYFGPQIDAMKDKVGDFMDKAGSFLLNFARGAVTTFGGALGAISGAWGAMPQLFKAIVDRASSAVQITVANMVNGVIDTLNKALLGAHMVNPLLPLFQIDKVKVGQLQGDVAGAMAGVAKAAKEGMEKGQKEWGAGFNDFIDLAASESRAHRDKRVMDKAGKAPKGHEAGLSDEAREFQNLMKRIDDATASLNAHAASQETLNAKIASGAMTTAQAARQAELASAVQEYEIELTKRQGKEAEALRAKIADLSAAKERDMLSDQTAQLLKDNEDSRERLTLMDREAELAGLDARTREVRLAGMKAEQDLKGRAIDQGQLYLAAQVAELNGQTALAQKYRDLAAAADEYVATAEATAGKEYDKADAVAELNRQLERQLGLLKEVDQAANESFARLADAVGNLSDAMGSVTHGIGGIVTALSGWKVKEGELATERKKLAADSKTTSAQWAEFEIKAARTSADARRDAYGQMIAAGADFFERGSDGWKAMQVAMIAFRTVEALTSLQAIAAQGAETAATTANVAARSGARAVEVATHVAAEGTKATASGIAAYARTLASLPFPLNLAAGATVLAALAAVGVALHGGGASGLSVPEQNQRDQGTGSVLGDAKAKSDSIAHSLEIVAANSSRLLEYSNPMLKALRSIDSNIGSLTAALARELRVGAVFSQDGLGSSQKLNWDFGVGGAVYSALLPGLFGTTVTKKLLDQGLMIGAQQLSDIVQNGLQAQSYQTIQTETKKRMFGLTYSDTSSTRTRKSDVSADLERAMGDVVASLKSGILEAADVLGYQGAEAALASFVVNIGKVSLKGLTGDEVEKQLAAIFSKVGDDMAKSAMPFLIDLQKVGEGAFETLMRVARQYQVVDVSLRSIGMTFGAVGVSSLKAREHLVDLFGSLDEFTDKTGFFADNFLSEAERLAPVQAAVAAELNRLGLNSVRTRDQFKAVVQGLDLSTAAGADLFAALMALAPGFAAVTAETQALTDARSALSTAYDRESGALQDTIDRMRDLAHGLHDFGVSLYSGPAAALSPEAAYMAAQAEFARVSGLARQGDQQALGQLQDVSQAYLDASRDYYASSEGYFNDLAAVRDAVTAAEQLATAGADTAQQQLDAMTAQVGQLIDLNRNVLSVEQAIANLTAVVAGSGIPVVVAGAPAAPAVPAAPAPAAAAPASNDNGEVVGQLRQLVDGIGDLKQQLTETNDRLAAANQQRGAVAVATLDRLEDLTTAAEKQVRALTA